MLHYLLILLAVANQPQDWSRENLEARLPSCRKCFDAIGVLGAYNQLRPILKDVGAVDVEVRLVNVGQAKHLLPQDDLKVVGELGLRRNGLEVGAGSSSATLYLHVRVFCSNDMSCAAFFEANLGEPVLPMRTVIGDRQPIVKEGVAWFGTPRWATSGVPELSEVVRAQLNAVVDEFANDYYRANPKSTR